MARAEMNIREALARLGAAGMTRKHERQTRARDAPNDVAGTRSRKGA